MGYLVAFVLALILWGVLQARRNANAPDKQIRDLKTEVAMLSERLRLLVKRVDRLKALVDKDGTEAGDATVPEVTKEPGAEGETEEDAVHLPAVVPESSTALEPRYQPTPEAEEAPEEAEPSTHEPSAPEPIAAIFATPEPVAAVEPEVPSKVIAAAVKNDDLVAPREQSLEQKLSTNWLVWIGGVALALAGVFFVRYVAEQGWLSPATRCAIGVVFGFSLVVAGEVIRRRPLERAIAAIRADYVPQALTAAGVVTAFGSVYLAYAFYDLIPSGWSFMLLAGIALAAFALSIVEGALVATLGLAGAIATPALVSTADPSAWGFFTYLGIIAVATIWVADRRNWYWLPELALFAISGWAVIWIVQIFVHADIVPIGATFGVVAVVSLILALRASSKSKEPVEINRWNVTSDMVAWTGLGAAAAAAFTLTLISDFAPAAHWLVLCFAIAAAAIARFAPRFDLSLPAVASLSIAAFALNYIDSSALANLAERALGWPMPTEYFVEKYSRFATHAVLIAVAIFGGGTLSLSRAARPNSVALASGAVPLLLLLIGYAQFRNFTGDNVWALAAAAVLIAATLTTAYLRRAEGEQTVVQNIYAAVAVIAAFSAATFLFDRIWLTLAYAGLVLAVALVSTRADLLVLRRLVNLIVLVVLVRLTVNPDMRGYEIFYPMGMQWVTYGYLVPMALFIIASRIFKRSKDDLTVTVLEGAALLLCIVFVSTEIRIIMTGSIYSGAYRLPEMSLQTIAWLTSALILARRNLRYPRIFSTWGSRLLTAVGSAQAVVLQLILVNPVFTGDFIQGYGLFNLLILSLLAPAVLIWLIAGSLLPAAQEPDQRSSFALATLRVFSMLLAFAFVTEEIRVMFQGMLISPEHASLLELYVTTLVWLLPASVPYFLTTPSTSPIMQKLAMVTILLSVIVAVLGHAWIFNPAMTGELVRGWPIFNTLLLGFFVPAAILYALSTRVLSLTRYILVGACYYLVFIGLWLMIKHGFEGARLAVLHESLLELYVTTLAWILLGALPFTIRRIGGLTGAEVAGFAVLAVSIFMLFAGHTVFFNPVFDGSYVRGWPVFNVLLLGFIVPSALIGLIARRLRPDVRSWFHLVAYMLLFIGVTMLVKHTFQGAVLSIRTLTSFEDYGYSAAWLVLAIATMIAGIVINSTYVRYASLAVLLLVVLKVFVLDMSGLAGLWRVASFFGLGIGLIGIGWIYQNFVYSQDAKPKEGAPVNPKTQEK